MTDEKLYLNKNLGEIRNLVVSDTIDYKLEFITEKFESTDPIWRTEIIKINIFG